MNESDSSKKGRRVDLFFFDKREAPFGQNMIDRALFFVPRSNKREVHSLEMSLKNGEDNFYDFPKNVNFNRKNNIHELYDKFRASDASERSKKDIWKLRYNSVSNDEKEVFDYIKEIPFSDKPYITSNMAYLLSKNGFTDVEEVLDSPSGDITDVSGIGKRKLQKMYYGIFFDNVVRLAKDYNEATTKSLNRKRYYKLYCLFSKYSFSDSTEDACSYAFNSIVSYRNISLNENVFNVDKSGKKLKFPFKTRIKSSDKTLFLKYLAKLSQKASSERSMFALNDEKFVKKVLTKDEHEFVDGDLFAAAIDMLVDKIDHELEIRDSYWQIMERYLKN